MNRHLTRSIAFLAVAALFGSPLVVPAAPYGMAWDSVTKMAMGSDASSLQPGSFDDDFATASSTQTQKASGGGIFGQLKQAIAVGQNLGAMMANGLAERHYVAGSKERTDEVSLQTATITDCVARTITTLNLAQKTYNVVSMDQPSTPSSGGGTGGGGSMPKDDGTKIAISVVNSGLGVRTVGGEPTRGFRSDMTITETKPSGESHTQNANLVGYYAGFSMPAAHCSRFGLGSGMSPGQQMAAMAAAARVMRALASAGYDKRFSLKQSGPPLPAGNLAMWQAMTFGAEEARGTATFLTERGHVRSITANDPIFSVPHDFTQER